MHFDGDLIVIFGFTALIAIGYPIARAIGHWIRAQAHAQPSAALPDGLAERLERLEHIAEATQIEFERMSEGQRFTTKLLTERANPASGERVGGADATR